MLTISSRASITNVYIKIFQYPDTRAMPRSQVVLWIMTAAFSCSLIFVMHYDANYILTVHANQTPQLPGVKITSHLQNQQVPTGIFSIIGTSTDNSTTDCDVYIILNEIKPYQRVTPTGNDNMMEEDHDYSTWNYTFTPEYAMIQEGNNRMVSKITCMDQFSINNENLTKFNSLNVTGISISNTTIDSEQVIPIPESSTNLTYSDLVQSQDLDSTDANPDKRNEEGNDNKISNERDNEGDDSEDEGANYREKVEEIGKEFMEELHDSVSDQVRDQLRRSGIDLPE